MRLKMAVFGMHRLKDAPLSDTMMAILNDVRGKDGGGKSEAETLTAILGHFILLSKAMGRCQEMEETISKSDAGSISKTFADLPETTIMHLGAYDCSKAVREFAYVRKQQSIKRKQGEE